jgi:hypothetical protein
MKEKLLHYIWQYQLFNNQHLKTIEGESLMVINPGFLNTNQGPDFLNGKIKIQNTFWVGSIEIHIKTSDWDLHKHSTDNNYNNVVLHVVWHHDKNIHVSFQTLELKSLVPKILLEKYKALLNTKQLIPCSNSIRNISTITIEKWKERLLVERFQHKAKEIEADLKSSNGNWENVCWWLLAKYMGGTINGEAFKQIAKSLPLTILKRHAESLFQLEALLMGQAGFLEAPMLDEYASRLLREYEFLAHKYSLVKPKIVIQFLRMRPFNFPTIRLSQLAMMLSKSTNLLSKIIDENDLNLIAIHFNGAASAYWDYHYRFDELSDHRVKIVGNQTIQSIIINYVTIILYAYGYYHNIEALQTKALQWLEKIPPEKNTIIDLFTDHGIKNKTAFDSQALIQLKKEYCDHKKCLNCAIGNAILRG